MDVTYLDIVVFLS